MLSFGGITISFLTEMEILQVLQAAIPANRSLTWPYEADDGATWQMATGGSWYVETSAEVSFKWCFCNGNCEIDFRFGNVSRNFVGQM